MFLDIFKNILIKQETLYGVYLCLKIEKEWLKLHLQQLEDL
jgi:hypothetical protein